MVTEELAAAAERAGLSTNILSKATGIPRSSFSYWIRKDVATRRPPLTSREPYIKKLTQEILRAIDAGELPAPSPRDAVAVIKRRMAATD